MMKEPEIKLFGRKIFLPESSGESSMESGGDGGVDCVRSSDEGDGGEKEESGDESKAEEKENGIMAEDEDKNPDDQSESDENSKSPSNDNDTTSGDHSKSVNGQDKALKKPDKILPCPRCNSMDTKFCYYNNYNVNQPRHFCRSCQRYWTAGGTMRNVPVGAGRRKNKNSTSHCHHITISEALQAARINAPNRLHDLKFKPNSTVLSFGPNSPLCESMASALTLAEERPLNNAYGNVCCKINSGGSVSYKNEEMKDSGSGDGVKNFNGFSSQRSCIPAIPWPFPVVVYPPGYPLSYCPAPYLNYSFANAWNVPWISVPSPPTTNQRGASLGPGSPLGKHSRNGDLIKQNSSDNDGTVKPVGGESSIVVPKMLRIDDPEEAAKSSIWDTLGIKYDSVSRKGLFKALQPKGHEKKQMAGTSPSLQANPAALSRSISFQETA